MPNVQTGNKSHIKMEKDLESNNEQEINHRVNILCVSFLFYVLLMTFLFMTFFVGSNKEFSLGAMVRLTLVFIIWRVFLVFYDSVERDMWSNVSNHLYEVTFGQEWLRTRQLTSAVFLGTVLAEYIARTVTPLLLYLLTHKNDT